MSDQVQKSKQLASTFPNMVMIMTLLAVISAGALGLTYTGTAERIAQNALEKQKAALGAVLPSFTNDPVSEAVVSSVDGRITLYPAMENGRLTGLGVQSYSDRAFGGSLTLMAGFDSQGKLLTAQALQHAETPGLGSKITLASFVSQFEGLVPAAFPLAVTRDGGQVDSITAATISSRAYVEALNRAQAAAQAYFQEVQ